MTIEQAKLLKDELVNDIEKLLTNFTDATGTVVDEIYMHRHTPTATFNFPACYAVKVEVML